jgi:serine/threonine protein kinase
MQQQFLHYTITSILERHTASTSYLAVHNNRPASTIVLKIFHQPTFSNASQERTFLQEMDKLSYLSHPHLVPILEAGIENGQAYIVSAYMPNGSLRVRLDRAYPQRLPVQQAMTIITQIGQGLAYLHARHLTHGHIKPEHILFDANGRALLSDPRCAANPPVSIHDENASASFCYLAPEQFVAKQSDLSDQYALCCLAYELLTGRPVFTSSDPQKLLEQQQSMEPTPLRQIVSSLSPTIEQAILKGLAKDPTYRHADIASFLAGLQHAQASPDLPLPRSKRRISPLAPPIPTGPPTSQSDMQSQQSRPSTAPESSSSQPPIDPSSRTIRPQFQSRPDKGTEDLDQEDLFAPPAIKRMPTSQSDMQSQQSRPSTASEDFDFFLGDMTLEDGLESMQSVSADQDNQPENFDTFLQDIMSEDEANATLSAPTPAAQNDVSNPFDEVQRVALEEILLAINDNADPTATIDLSDAELTTVFPPQMEFPAFAAQMKFPAFPAQPEDPEFPVQPEAPEFSAYSEPPGFQAYSADPGFPAYQKAPGFPAQQEAPGSPAQPGIIMPVTTSFSKQAPAQAFAVGTFKWKMTSKNAIIWSLVLLLMIGCLWTYSALAATSSTSSTLTLLSNLPNPTPQPTIDALGILSPASMKSVGKTPTPTLVPTPKATPKPTPQATPRPTPTSIPGAPVIIPTLAPAPIPTPQPTAKPQPTAPIGQTIWLKSTINGDYVNPHTSTANGPLYADASQVQALEEFRVVDAGNGLIALQSVGNGDYVTAEIYTENVPLDATATAISTWEQFQWINLGNGDIALRSKVNGNYVSTWVGTANAPVYAMVDKISTWETLQWGAVN